MNDETKQFIEELEKYLKGRWDSRFAKAQILNEEQDLLYIDGSPCLNCKPILIDLSNANYELKRLNEKIKYCLLEVKSLQEKNEQLIKENVRLYKEQR